MSFWGLLLCSAVGDLQQPDTVIRTTTTLVEVRVVAVDSAGRPVTDLRRDDFSIFDDSRQQTLALFWPPLRGNGKASTSSAGETEPTPDSYAILLIDLLNTSYVDQVRVQDCILRLLKNFQPRQNLGLYVMSPASHLLCDFTQDRNILTALVERMELGLPHGDPPMPPVARGKETIRALNQVADHLLHVPGRKTLIWPSQGFNPIVGPARAPQMLFFQSIEKSLAKLNAADVAVHTIDATGLRMSTNLVFDYIREISTRTGGTAFAERNDLDEGMRLAFEDTAASYTLGFHAAENGRRGLHPISVRVDRAGIKLRYRETYDPSASVKRP